MNLRTLVAALMGILSFGVSAAEGVDRPTFELKLGGDWVADKGEDPQQYSYYSKSLGVAITTSSMIAREKITDTERIASRLKDHRLEAERRAASEANVQLTILEPTVTPFSRGHEISYYGHDNTNRQFRYLSLVMDDKIINIYAESPARSERELKDIFNDILTGLRY